MDSKVGILPNLIAGRGDNLIEFQTFFFLTLTGSALTLVWLIGQVHTGLVSATTGWVLLATLLGLAIVEHVLMAFPLSIEKLWGWAMSRAASRPLAEAAVLPTLPVALPVHAAKVDPP